LSPHAKGLLITVAGVLLISPDSLLIRVVDADRWTILFWRGFLMATAFGFLVVVTSGRKSLGRWRAIGGVGVIIALLMGAASLFFVLAIATANVATVLVILSTTSLFSAILSAVVFSEPIARPTWIASVVVVLALTLIFSGQLAGAELTGTALALVAVLLLSSNLALLRASQPRDIFPILALGGVVTGVGSMFLAAPFDASGRDMTIMVFAGLLLLPAAIGLLTQGPRYLPAPEVGLVFLLETLLGPLWVWLGIGQAPEGKAVLAGAVILAVLVAHSLVQWRGTRAVAAVQSQ
jgi:drug/metabolite transporter (DMT)-like permease